MGADKTPDGQKQISAWQATIDRWESEPSTNEGRKELIIKAKDLEAKRDQSFAQDNAYDSTALILQLGIVLASVALISSMMIFAIAGGVLDVWVSSCCWRHTCLGP
jgi:hypothetical protein